MYACVFERVGKGLNREMQSSQPRYSIERLRGHQWTLVCLQSVDSVGAYMRKHTAGKLKVKSAIQDAGAVCQKCPNKA